MPPSLPNTHSPTGRPLWLAGVVLRQAERLLPRYIYWRARLGQQSRAWRRRLRRRLAVGVAGAALLLSLAGVPEQGQIEPAAATNVITVVNGEVVVQNNGKCSLNEAIQNANNKTNGRPNADCAAGNPNGADTINLPANGVFMITTPFVPDAEVGPIGLPWFASTITLNGNGSIIQRANNAVPFRIMAVGQQGNVTLNNATVTNGYLYVDEELYYGYYDIGGGGILNQGQLTISGSTITSNKAHSYSYVARGGGILNRGLLTISNSSVMDNSADSYYWQGAFGGGIFNEGTLTISNGTITNNDVLGVYYGFGGGIYSAGNLSIAQSSISGNRVLGGRGGTGGGIVARGSLSIAESTLDGNTIHGEYSIDGGALGSYGSASIVGTTFSRNWTYAGEYDDGWSDDSGGAIFNMGPMTIVGSTFVDNGTGQDGGAVYNRGLMTIANTTISRNNADRGGGVANANDLTLNNVTLSGNGSGVLATCQHWLKEHAITRVERTIITGNGLKEAERIDGDNCTAALIANNYNIFGHSGNSGLIGLSPGATDIVPSGNLATILSPLANNGGLTQTHALPAGSPALDRAPNTACTAAPVNGVDQRGEPRNQNGSGASSSNECDVGAFERPGGAPPVAGVFYISPAKAGNVGGVAFAPADILKFDPATGWSLYFDGSDVGITKNVSAFELQADGSILLSLSAAQAVSGAGAVAPHDVIRFTPTATGPTTTGTFQMWVDGSNVGLTTTNEKIDALGLTAAGHIAISTTGAAAVAGQNGTTLKAQDEDALAFNRSQATWQPFFNGTALPGLGVEDVSALWINPTTGEIYIAIVGGFNLGGVRGDGKDIVKLTPNGGGYTAALYWDGSAAGLPTTIDALEMAP